MILSPTHHAVADDALLSGDVAPAAVGTSLRDPPPSSLRVHLTLQQRYRGGQGAMHAVRVDRRRRRSRRG